MLNGEELIGRSDGGSLAESGVLEVEELFAKDWRLAGDENQHRSGRDNTLRLALTFLDWPRQSHEFIDCDERSGDVIDVGRDIGSQWA